HRRGSDGEELVRRRGRRRQVAELAAEGAAEHRSRVRRLPRHAELARAFQGTRMRADGTAMSNRYVGGALVVLAIAATYAVGRVQTLNHDRTQTWSYARVPHSAPTPLERRLGDAASAIARRPVQVRCAD